MPIEFSDAGLSIQTYEEVLGEVQEEFRQEISTSIATDLKSMAGQIQRIIALAVHRQQEKIQQLYQSLDPRLASGVHLDIRLGSTLGVTRLPAGSAEVLGTITGTAATMIPDGTRLSVGGFEFSVINGPYTIGGGSTVSDVRLRSTLEQPIDVSTLGAWTIVDAVLGFDSFDDDEQPIAGRLLETDAEFRERAEVERFARAGNSLAAIDARVGLLEGVTYAKAWHHVDPALGDPDPVNGIPLYAINVVVEGGDADDIAQAILDAGPAGTLFYGTDETVTLGTGVFEQDVSFDRVAEVDIWINIALTSSTSEETIPATAELEARIDELLLAYTTSTWQIGKDVLPAALAGVIASSDITGIDDVTVTVSTDNGAGDAFSSAKRSISIRQRAVFTATQVVVTQV